MTSATPHPRLLLLALCAAALAPRAQAQALTWAAAPSLPFARSDHTATALGSSIYIAGGCDGAQKCNLTANFCACTSITRNLVAFTPTNGSYSPRAPMLQPRYRHLACPLLDESGVVIFGGRTLADALITDIDVYSVARNSWSTLGVAYPADLGSDNSCTTALSGKIYVMGGYDQYYNISTRVMYELTLGGANGGSFRRVADMPIGLGDFASALIPATGNIHIMGGYSTELGTDWSCRPTASHYIYSPATNTWARGIYLPNRLAEKDDPVLLGGRLYTIGGETKSMARGCGDTNIIPLADVFSYDPATAQWRNETYLPIPIMRTAGSALGGVAYIFGGQGSIIDGGDTVPLLFSVYSYALPPAPPAGSPAPVAYDAGSMGGAIVGTALVTLMLAACVRMYIKSRKGASGDKTLLTSSTKAELV